MIPTGAARFAGVAGHPVAHSLSPVLMRHWIDAADLDALYVPFPVAPEDFARVVAGLARAGCAGLNVTLPHKEAALELSDTASASARARRSARNVPRRDCIPCAPRKETFAPSPRAFRRYS